MKYNATKIISIIMVLILLLGAFVGCGDQNSTTLSDKQKQEIEEDWFKIEGKPIEWWDFENEQYEGARYYGRYNGYHIIFMESISMTGDEGMRPVGEFLFHHPDNFQIYAYKNGKFYSLSEAYEKGLLKEKQIQEIYDTHWHKYQKQVYPVFYERHEVLMNTEIPSTYVPPVSNELLEEIESKWLEKYGYEIKWRDIEHGQYNGAGYYGTFSDCFIIFEPTETIEGAEDFLIIHNYKFLYPEKFVFLVYKDGEFYTMKEAYWKELLPLKHIKYLSENHADRVKQMYPEFYKENYS